MSDPIVDENLRNEIFKLALKNAIEHNGKAAVGPVMSKVMGQHPELRSRAREILAIVKEVISEINKLTLEQQLNIARKEYPDILAVKTRKEEIKRGLPPLPNAKKYKMIITRFAPNPDFLIHLGNARPALLSYEYAKMYKGKMILRFEDTDPKTKAPMPEAYEIIKEDLHWLGIKWDEEYIQSLRMPIYYSIVKDLIKVGGAYVDLCSQNEFRKYKLERKPCPHRNQSIEDNLELLDKVLEGHFGEGEAVIRVKTDLNYPDPSVIDWVAFRIIDTDKYPHPIVGSKYILWPTYNFAAAVDDHLMGVTHILRGKEHAVNTIKQKFLYTHLGWEYPEVINLGRLKLEGFILSKSKIKELLKKYPSKFLGPNDPRFGTIASLRNRGIESEAIRHIIMEVGVKSTDASISWDNLASLNRKMIDIKSKRVMVVFNPVKVRILNYKGDTEIEIPFHPGNKKLGYRVFKLSLNRDNSLEVFIERNDLEELTKKGGIRLMSLCNIKLVKLENNEVVAEYIDRGVSKARELGLSIIQWIPANDYISVKMLKPEGLKMRLLTGVGEPSLTNLVVNEKIQIIRNGFALVKNVKARSIKLLYIHD